MRQRAAKHHSGDTLVLSPVLDLRAAAPLAAAILTAHGNQLVLDGSNVEKVGAQCLQIIVSARKTWERDGLSLSIANPSRELEEAFAIAGLSIMSYIDKGC